MHFFPSVQLDITRVSAANERDIKLNTRREISYLQAAMYYSVHYINTGDDFLKISEQFTKTSEDSPKVVRRPDNRF